MGDTGVIWSQSSKANAEHVVSVGPGNVKVFGSSRFMYELNSGELKLINRRQSLNRKPVQVIPNFELYYSAWSVTKGDKCKNGRIWLQ
jgi:hypothetical protein